MCPGTSHTRALSADLLAPLLRCLLVRFGLLGSVQGILLVQFQHLHLFLDGIHGGGGLGRVPARSTAEIRAGKAAGEPRYESEPRPRGALGPTSAGRAPVECGRRAGSASLIWPFPGGWLHSSGHPILFWKGLFFFFFFSPPSSVCPYPFPSLRSLSAFFGGSAPPFAAARLLTVEMPIYGMWRAR